MDFPAGKVNSWDEPIGEGDDEPTDGKGQLGPTSQRFHHDVEINRSARGVV